MDSSIKLCLLNCIWKKLKDMALEIAKKSPLAVRLAKESIMKTLAAAAARVTAAANPGYQFATWSDGVLTASRTDSDVTNNLMVTASFACTAPVVSLNGPSSITLGRNQPFIDPGATALDACAGSLAPVESGSVIPNVPGIYLLTYSATNLAGNTGTATLTVTVTDAPPVVSNFAFGAVIGLPVNVSIINGKCAPVSQYGDPLTVNSVSGETNGTVSFTATNLAYTATNGTLDSLTYVVTDPYGTMASGQITVNIITNGSGYNQILAAMPMGGNQVVLSYLGIPGNDYALEWTSSLTPPMIWTPQQTNTAAIDGTLNFTNSTALPQNFYRTRSVP